MILLNDIIKRCLSPEGKKRNVLCVPMEGVGLPSAVRRGLPKGVQWVHCAKAAPLPHRQPWVRRSRGAFSTAGFLGGFAEILCIISL